MLSNSLTVYQRRSIEEVKEKLWQQFESSQIEGKELEQKEVNFEIGCYLPNLTITSYRMVPYSGTRLRNSFESKKFVKKIFTRDEGEGVVKMLAQTKCASVLLV